MAVGLNVTTAYVWLWAGICARLGLTSNTSGCFVAFPPELDLTVNTTSHGTCITSIITTDWQKLSTYKRQKISDPFIGKEATRRHSESAYIRQVHDNVTLWCTRLHIFICASLVMDVCSRRLPTIMTSSIMTACSGVCWKSIGNGVNIFVHFSSTPTSILNLAISSKSQYNDVSNDISSVWKYSRLFMHGSNIFLLKQLWIYRRRAAMMTQLIYRLLTDGRKDRRKETQASLDLRQFHSVHLADITNWLCNSLFIYCSWIYKLFWL